MKAEKTFDCVQIKNEAQAALRRDLAGLSAEERRARIAHELDTSNNAAAVKWRSLQKRQVS